MAATSDQTMMDSTAYRSDVYRDEDDIFDDLERDDDDQLASIREKRMHQLKKEMEHLQDMKLNAHGDYQDIKTEKEVLQITTGTSHCIVHFYHKEFRRCHIMDKHLATLARKHFKVRFIKVDVEKTPFLVDRLKIQVLPCVISFVNGVSVDRLIGFEELGDTDQFTTLTLEKRLAKCNVISDPTADVKPSRKGIFGFADKTHSDSEDDD